MADHIVEDLRRRVGAEGPTFWVAQGLLGVFDPAAADRLDAENFQGVLLPDRLSDLIRPARQRTPVAWAEVRAALFDRARRLSSPDHLLALYERMRAIAHRTAGPDVDLARFAQRIATESLIPLVLADLTPAELRAVQREVFARVDRLFSAGARAPSVFDRLGQMAAEIAGGRAVRRVLEARHRGRRSPADDMAEGVLPLYDRLGGGRAAYAVTTVLSAIAGAPGPVFACLLFELQMRPDLARRIAAEAAGQSLEAVCAAPTRAAPLAHDFVREVLRLWTFPLLVRRTARRPLSVDGACVGAQDSYLLSPYVAHRATAGWANPDAFDPDRWSRSPGCGFAPFGFGQRTCIGAAIGLSHLILFCRLATRELQVRHDAALEPGIRLTDMAAPRDFRGEVAFARP